MVSVPGGAVYPTHHGLVIMSGKSAPDILTKSYYADTDWQNLRPDTLKVEYFEGRLFCFMSRGAFCLVIKGGAGTGGEMELHTELSLRPDETFVTRTGRFYLRFGDEVKEWDRGVVKMQHYYESGEALLGVPFGFGAAQIRMDLGVENFRVTCDGYEALNEDIRTNDTFALPLWATGQEWRWMLSGTARVKMVGLAPSTKEL